MAGIYEILHEESYWIDPHVFRPGLNFTNILWADFALTDPESVKNTVKLSVSFYTFEIYVRKSWIFAQMCFEQLF